MLNADLHCHSTVSDGALAPNVLARRAKENGVELWALTDHDEIGGIDLARTAARDVGLPFVGGVEISITWAGHTVHIVGLGIDERHEGLLQGLAETRSGREKRARDMAAQFDAIGIHGTFEGALRFVDNPDLISRTHFARFLVEEGVCPNVATVFRRYLTHGKPGYVPHRWATLEQSVRWIRDAGGVAVVAHPGRYAMDGLTLHSMLETFKDLGGLGIEVVTGSHTPDQYGIYADVARRYGFLASRGSDFHAPGESRADLGTLPPLPETLVPIWSRLPQ